MHADEPEMITEEDQKDFIKASLDVADKKGFVAGMHVWTFSDFNTRQSLICLGGISYTQ